MQVGREYEEVVASELPHSRPEYVSLPEGAEKTLQLMQEGQDRIYQAVLLHDNLLGIPDFLERVDLPSNLGNHSYRPVDVKISESAKPEHIAQLAFYGVLIEQIQGVLPEYGALILVDCARVTINLTHHADEVLEALDTISQIKEGHRELPTRSSECGLCPWHDYCLPMLYAVQDISLIDGLGREKKKALLSSRFTDIEAIAKASAQDLTQVRGIGEKTADRIVAQAQVLIDKEPRVLAIPQFPDAAVELHLDMECQEQTQIIYLIGVLEHREGNVEEFREFLAERPEHEAELWSELLDYLDRLPDDTPIYHYHHFEKTHLQKLADRHGISDDLRHKLFDSLIDLHKVMKDSVLIPLHSYGLKPVAKWLGFKWRESDSDAAMSMLWFGLWLSTGSRKYLDLAVQYNEDDCRATLRIKEWLEQIADPDQGLHALEPG